MTDRLVFGGMTLVLGCALVAFARPMSQMYKSGWSFLGERWGEDHEDGLRWWCRFLGGFMALMGLLWIING